MSSGWVRLAALADDADLPAARKVELLAIAITELGIAQALAITHGQDNAARAYANVGAIIRFDDFGEPVIRRDARPRAGT